MLSALLPSPIVEKLGEAAEAELRECVALLDDRPALLRRLQLHNRELTLTDRQTVANALSKARKADPTLQSLLPPVLAAEVERCRIVVNKYSDDDDDDDVEASSDW